jgi:hypothetical protein
MQCQILSCLGLLAIIHFVCIPNKCATTSDYIINNLPLIINVNRENKCKKKLLSTRKTCFVCTNTGIIHHHISRSRMFRVNSSLFTFFILCHAVLCTNTCEPFIHNLTPPQSSWEQLFQQV